MKRGGSYCCSGEWLSVRAACGWDEAALHAEAPSSEATDWRQILALYEVLGALSDNPMVTLNAAIALAMVAGPPAGLERLATLDRDARLAGHHRLAAVRAHLLELSGEQDAAAREYATAAEGTTSEPEKRYLTRRAERARSAARG